MPASVYRMAGRPHPTEAPVADLAQVVPPTGELIESSYVETLDSRIDDQLEAAPKTAESDVLAPEPELRVAEEETHEPEPVNYPAWDPGWTKTKLLEVATSLKLGVTVENTKSQIIAALTRATST